ncbi:helix-turn-helix domain-containing protein [bacterium]|nr:helix-turn-helix domain-containing protein [bacterium]
MTLRKMTPEMIQTAKKLRDSGYSYKRIAKMLGVDDKTIRTWLKRSSINIPEGELVEVRVSEKAERNARVMLCTDSINFITEIMSRDEAKEVADILSKRYKIPNTLGVYMLRSDKIQLGWDDGHLCMILWNISDIHAEDCKVEKTNKGVKLIFDEVRK